MSFNNMMRALLTSVLVLILMHGHRLVTAKQRTEIGMQSAKYMVSIRTSQPTRFFGDNHFCAGVIIGTKLILTAAHCVVQYVPHRVVMRPRRIIVVAGTQNRLRRDKTTVELSVDTVVPHYGFRHWGGHDIAILKLKTGFPVDNDGIDMIPVMYGPPDIGSYGTILGWGRMYLNGPFATELLETRFEIVRTEVCELYLSQLCSDGIVCAYNMDNNNGDVCHGDSGGPLVINEKLVGILSQSGGCGIGYPTVFTGAYHHYNWIQQISGTGSKINMNLLHIVSSLLSLEIISQM